MARQGGGCWGVALILQTPALLLLNVPLLRREARGHLDRARKMGGGGAPERGSSGGHPGVCKKGEGEAGRQGWLGLGSENVQSIA